MEKELKKIFKEHNMKLVDCNYYENSPLEIPITRIVSHKWLARVLKKKLKTNDQ